MAETEKAGGGHASGGGSKSKSESADKETAAARANGAGEDAIELLKNDHRKVERLFAEYESASRRAKKAKLARQICEELIIHTMIEEEIFYPACREYLDDRPLDEAQVEHDTAKALINEILEGSPDEPFFDAKVKVLAEVIKHHIAEEEKRSEGIFAKAKAAGMEPNELLEELKERKEELEEQAEDEGLGLAETRSFLHQRLEMRGGRGGRGQARSRMMARDEDRGGYRRGGREQEQRFRSEGDDRRRFEPDDRERRFRGGDDEIYRGGPERDPRGGRGPRDRFEAGRRGPERRYMDDERDYR